MILWHTVCITHRNKALQKNEPAHGQSLGPPPLWCLPCSTSKEAGKGGAGQRQPCCPSVEATEATLSHRRDPDGGKKAATTGGRKDTPVLVTLSTMPFQPLLDTLYDVNEYSLEKQDIWGKYTIQIYVQFEEDTPAATLSTKPALPFTPEKATLHFNNRYCKHMLKTT